MVKPAISNEAKAKLLAEKIAKQIAKGAGKGLNSARVFLTARVKEALSVPAPRVIIRGQALPGKKKGPILGYRAATPATKGAPPRKLSGRLRSSITGMMVSELTAVIGTNVKSMPSKKYPGGWPYGRHHEVVDPARPSSGKHKFITPTAKKWRGAISAIIGKEAKFALVSA